MSTKNVAKYRLTQTLLRGLTVEQRPAHDADGKTVLIQNKGHAPYRFADGTPGAPGGFTIYVGPQGVFYEVRTRIGKKAVRIALGSVQELSLVRAHELAAEHRAHIRQTGEDPRQQILNVHAARGIKGITIGEAMQGYVDHLESLVARGKGEEGGVHGAKDSLARLSRPEVGLAQLPIATTTDR